MVEVLVALVVLSIGLLGLAMLQIKSMKVNTAAFQNTQATLLANEIIEKIRINRSGNYVATAKPSSRPTCSVNCPVNDVAKRDLYDWYENMATFLGPTATGGITKASTTQYGIVLSWYEQNTDTKQMVPMNRTWVVEF
jgi:type IV pilus assembly protein PilV